VNHNKPGGEFQLHNDRQYVGRHQRLAVDLHMKKLAGIFLAVLILVGCSPDAEIDSRLGIPGAGDTGDLLLETGTADPGWYQVYFSDPDSAAASTLRGGPDAHLAEAIDLARISVDVAMDSLNLWSLRDALLDAHRRGVAVRVVIESEALDSEEVQDLLEGGIQIVDDRRQGLMHNKFAIIDRNEVWTGSMNLMIGN
jgi:phosphatidylserine/phosphatidylglycerophosphate/cardiolipin synthase-like enzyme